MKLKFLEKNKDGEEIHKNVNIDPFHCEINFLNVAIFINSFFLGGVNL